MLYCKKLIRKGTKSKYLCRKEKGHSGACHSTPFLKHLSSYYPEVVKKIKRDSYNTRGNKTKPYRNRSFRWDVVVTEPLKHKNAKNLGIPVKEYASQEGCFKVARKLTRLTYEMEGSPVCPPEIEPQLDKRPSPGTAKCPICKGKLSIKDFAMNEWGKASVELCHLNPLQKNGKVMHTAENTLWAHRTCNIAQQERNLYDFLEWSASVIEAHGYKVSKPLQRKAE